MDSRWTIRPQGQRDRTSLPLHIIGFVAAVGWCCLVPAIAGPDVGIPQCTHLSGIFSPNQLSSLREHVQFLQASELYLQRQHPASVWGTSDLDTLKRWQSNNATELQRKLQRATERLDGSTTATLLSAATTCLSARLRPELFARRPEVSILLNYFKRPAVVTQIASVLRASCESVGLTCELVVNVDNPHEAAAWAAEAAAREGFVVPVFSANLHEARGYNRAARLARGRYFIIWQDDQLPSADGSWLVSLLRLFQTYPQLGIVGLNSYRLCRHMERGNRYTNPSWLPDPISGVNWTFVEFTDFAPLAVRAAAFHELGGLEEGWSLAGQCGIMGDWELCARAWVAGWQVGYMALTARSADPSAPGGTHVTGAHETCWGRQMRVGGQCLQRRYNANVFFPELCERVWLLNMLTFSVAAPEQCPYNDHETHFGNCTAPPLEQRPVLAAALRLPHAAG